MDGSQSMAILEICLLHNKKLNGYNLLRFSKTKRIIMIFNKNHNKNKKTIQKIKSNKINKKKRRNNKRKSERPNYLNKRYQ